LPISLEDQTQPISLDPSVATVAPIAPDIAENRANKATFGFSDINKSHQEYYEAILQGNEKSQRADVANQVDYGKQQQKVAVISQFAKTSEGPLTLEGYQAITKNVDLTPTNPSTIFEEGMSRRYMDTIYKTAEKFQGGWFDEAMRSMPELVKADIDKGASLLTKHQMIETRYENARNAVEQQGTFDYLADTFDNAIPFVFQARAASATPKADSVGTLGHALDKQRAYLMSLPPAELDKALDHIEEKLKGNPQAHAQFLSAMLGQSTAERTANDAITILDLTTLPAIGKLGAAVLRKVGLLNEVRSTVRDTFHSAEATNWSNPKLLSKENQFIDLEQTAPGVYGEAPKTKPVDTGEMHGPPERQGPPEMQGPKQPSPEYRAFVDDGTMEVFQNVREPQLPEVAAAAATGDLETAAVQRVTSRVIAGFRGKAYPEREAIESLTSNFKTQMDARERGVGQMGQEIVNRMNERTGNFVGELSTALKNIGGVTRLPGILVPEVASKLIADASKSNYKGIENRVMDYSELYFNKATKNYFFDIALGKHNAELFQSWTEANNVARWEGIKNPRIEKKGLGFFIRLTQPLDEKTPAIADYTAKLVGTEAGKTPDSFHSLVTNWIRNPDDALSLEQGFNRKATTYAPAKYMELAKSNMTKLIEVNSRFRGKGFKDALQNMGKFNDWDRAVKQERNEVDPVTGRPGYFYQTPLELESFYQRTFNRLPDEVETEAYFQFTDQMNFFKMLRNLDAYKMASRVGAEQFSISYLDGGKITRSPMFTGIRRSKIGGEWTVAVLTRNDPEGKVYLYNHMNPSTRKEIEERLATGEYQALEVYDTESRPLENFRPNFKNTKIRYVVTDAIERQDLPFKLADDRGSNSGGLIDYDYEFAIKQARLVPEKIGENKMKYHYEGDTNVTAIKHKAMGPRAVEAMNVVQALIRQGAEEAARLSYNNSGLPFPWNEFRNWFKNSTDINGNSVPAKLSLTEPFHVVGKNEMIVKIDSSLKNRVEALDADFVDGTVAGSLSRQNQVEFTGDRDTYENFTMMKDAGTRNNPLYKLEPANEIDPISTMNRALSKMINSTFMEDYKIFSMTTLLQEAAPWLKAKSDEIYYSPWSVFTEMGPKSFLPNAPLDVVSRILQAKQKVSQLIGVPSLTQGVLDNWSQKLADSIYSKAGPLNALEIPSNVPLIGGKSFALAPSTMLAHATDPIKFVRAAAFHMTMGMFNPAQILVQHMTFVNMMGISPRYAGLSAYSAVLDRMAAINPKMIDHLDNLATKLNMFGVQFRPGEFKEANELLRNNGYRIVGNEHTFADFGLPAPMVQSAGARFLDAGLIFFKGSERNIRISSYYTAFKEFRDEHPTGRLTNEDQNKILRRATDLAGNMDKSSKSMLETGVMAMPTQFLSYQIRMFDLLAGKRLKPEERARMFITNMALLGVPVAAGAALYPFGDMIRDYAERHGYRPGEDWLKSLAMEGGIATMIAALTGAGDIKKGNWYNVGPRFGFAGLDVINNIMYGDKTLATIYGGAALSKFRSAFESTDGMRATIFSLLAGDGDFPYVADDLIDPIKELGTGHAIIRERVALNTGKWLAKNGSIMLNNVSPLSSMFMTVTGLQPNQQTDQKTLVAIQKADKELRSKGEKLFKQEFTRGLNNQMAGNKDEARKNFIRARSYLAPAGIPDKEWMQLMISTTKDNIETVVRLRQDNVFGRNVPLQDRLNRLEQLKGVNKINSQKNQ